MDQFKEISLFEDLLNFGG